MWNTSGGPQASMSSLPPRRFRTAEAGPAAGEGLGKEVTTDVYSSGEVFFVPEEIDDVNPNVCLRCSVLLIR